MDNNKARVQPYNITPTDVIRFNKAHLNRAQTNLVGAETRGDTRAAANIARKIAIYQYTISLAECYTQDTDYINKHVAEAGEPK